MYTKSIQMWKIGGACIFVSGLLVWVIGDLITSMDSLCSSIGIMMLFLAFPMYIVGSKLIQSSNSFFWRAALLGSECGFLMGLCFFVFLPGVDHDWLSAAIFLSAALYKSQMFLSIDPESYRQCVG
jgi:hypothetical protein